MRPRFMTLDIFLRLSPRRRYDAADIESFFMPRLSVRCPLIDDAALSDTRSTLISMIDYFSSFIFACELPLRFTPMFDVRARFRWR